MFAKFLIYRLTYRFLLASTLLISSTVSQAEILGTRLRIWATDPGQKSTSAYMILTSHQDAVIVNVTSPIAKHAAFFHTVVIGNSLKLRRMERLPLAAGTPVDFTKENYQLIFSELKYVIQPGQDIPVTLELLDKNKQPHTITLSLTAYQFTE